MITLPHVLFVVTLELAAGGFFVLLYVDRQDKLPAGFRAFTGGSFLLSTALALYIFTSAPLADPTTVVSRELLVATLWASVVAMALFTVTAGVVRRVVPNALGWLAFLTSTVATGLSAVEFAAASKSDALALLAFGTGAAAMGAVMTGMFLGHWYLVTPSLPVRPLRRIVALLFGIQVVQALLVPVLLALSTDAGSVLGGMVGVLFWLRVVVGIAFPIVLTVLTWQCCRIRSLQSATGLLYIAVACVVSGEIAAKSLFFMTRVPL